MLAKFVRFCVKCNLHFTAPTDESVCMFFEQCLTSVKSAATIKNYAAALTSSYHQMGLDTAPFQAYKVRLALKSIDKNVRHVPSPAPPVTPNLLKKVVKIANRLPEGQTVVAALVVMYHTFFRQSNLAAPSSIEFDYTRQLTRDDVSIKRDALVVAHKWSKSHQAAGRRASVTIPAIPDSPLCPKAAVIAMINQVPTRHPKQPFLCFSDRNHMPISYLRRMWSLVLQALAVPNWESYTLHGLRRGAASHVLSADPSARQAIKEHGMWRSDVVDRYLPNVKSKVFHLMRDTL